MCIHVYDLGGSFHCYLDVYQGAALLIVAILNLEGHFTEPCFLCFLNDLLGLEFRH